MALSTDQIAKLLFKKYVGKGQTNDARDFFQEPFDGRITVFSSQIWIEEEEIPTTAPSLAPDGISGVVQYKQDVVLSPVAGTTNSFQSNDLIDAIPFNFGDGSYNYVIEDSINNGIPFGQNDWFLDTESGVLTFYNGVPANMPPKVSFYKYIGAKGNTGLSADKGYSIVVISARDNTVTSLPAGAGPIVVDGYTVQNGDRILFTNLVTGNNKVYEASGIGTSVQWQALESWKGTVDVFEGAHAFPLKGSSFGNKLQSYNNATWTISGYDESTVILRDGSQEMLGDLDLGGNKIISLADPTASGDATNKDYVDTQDASTLASANSYTDGEISTLSDASMLLDGSQAMTGDMNLDGNQINSLATPTLSGDAANKFYVDSNINDTLEIIEVDGEPTGFPNRDDSQISFVDGTRTFTIQPTSTSYDYWIKSTKYTKTGSDSVVIPDTEGLYFIYFDGETLTQDAGPPEVDIFRDVAYVAILYWDYVNNSAIYIGDERHGLTMDAATHDYLHNTQGTVYESGLALDNFLVDGNGTLDAHAQLDCSNGVIRDEDITLNIENGQPQTLTPIAQLPVYYRLGTNGAWRKKTADNFPIIYSGTAGYTGSSGLLPFNEFTGTTWQLTELSTNQFVLVHIFATNNITEPVISVQGINSYNNVNDARDGAENEIQSLSGLPFTEFLPIGTVIYETSTSFSNTISGIVISTSTGSNYIDFRDVKVLGTGSVTDHGNLSGLLDDDHTIYLRTDGQRTLQGDMSIGGNKLTSLGSPTLSGDATNKDYVDTQDASTLSSANSYTDVEISILSGNVMLLDGSQAMTSDMDLGGNKIVSLAEPTVSGDAATKNYVDTQLDSGVDSTVPLTASGAIVEGSPVFVVKTADETVSEADASTIGTSRLVGISKESISDSSQGDIIVSGFAVIPLGQIDGGSFDVGEPVFLSETAGNLTSTAPSTSGSRVYQVGIAVSSTKLVVDLKQGIINV